VGGLAALSAVPSKDALPVADAAGNAGFLLRNGSTVVYLSAVCSHGGCNVEWDSGNGRFVCPCHLSEFDRTGRVLNPPAPGPLTARPVTVVDGQVRLV
jgi:Rieske Fe-S protein